ncbi:MAG: hypothetical protein AAFU71_09180 [Cyanobacteria bacterium J06632_22]
MSAEPAWCLMQVKPEDVPLTRSLFSKHLHKKEKQQQLEKYLSRHKRQAHLLGKELEDFPFFSQNPENFDCYTYVEDAFLFLDENVDLFFVNHINALLNQLWDEPQHEDCVDNHFEILELVVAHRVAPTQMLIGGLGWQKATQLPGYLGNMLILPEEVDTALSQISDLLDSVDYDAYFARAKTIGGRGMDNDSVATEVFDILPSTLRWLSGEGCGLLALSHGHLGSFPFPAYAEEQGGGY